MNLSSRESSIRPPQPLSWLDLIVYSLLIVFCYFSFQTLDLPYTGGVSLSYVFGHFTDFYDFNEKHVGLCNYLPSTYILFAVWNLPLRLLGFIDKPTLEVGALVFWFKLLPTLFVAGTAYHVYRIGRAVGLSAQNAKQMAAFWLTSPLMIFSQFIFGQYDILTTFFVVAGLHALIEDHRGKFILYFAIAVTFKYFALFLFLPLLLLKEKRPARVLLSLSACLLPALAEILLYHRSPGFQNGVMHWNIWDRMYEVGLGAAHGKVPLFFLSWALLCIHCHFKYPDDEADSRKWMLYAPLAASGLFFLFVHWHPQWLLIMTPFLCMTTFLNKKSDSFIILDIGLFYFFLALSTQMWAMNVDQALWQRGIWGSLNPALFDPNTTVYMFKFLPPSSMDLKTTGFVVCLAAHLLFKSPGGRFMTLDAFQPFESYVNLARVRLAGGLALFLIPALISFFLCLPISSRARSSPPRTDEGAPATFTLGAGDVLTQSFTAKGGRFNRLSFRVAGIRYTTAPKGSLDILLKNDKEQKALLHYKAPWTKLTPGAAVILDSAKDIPLIGGERYTLSMKATSDAPIEFTLSRGSLTDVISDLSIGINGLMLCREVAPPGKDVAAKMRCGPALMLLDERPPKR